MTTIVATVGASNANSYVDLAFADAYFDARLGSSTWTDQSDDDVKASALIQATMVLDSLYDWNGWLATDTQALRWPRDGALNYDQAFGPNSMYDFDNTLTAYFENTVVPLQVKRAVCELAISLLDASGFTGEVNTLDTVRVGPIRVDFSKTTSERSLPNTVIGFLRHMGTFCGEASGGAMTTVSLVRT